MFFNELLIYFPESILNWLSRELNLGEYNPYMAYDAMYGFSLEGYHWVKRWIWIASFLTLICLTVLVKQKMPLRKYWLMPFLLIVSLVPALWYVNTPQQVLTSNGSSLDREIYDYQYYNNYSFSHTKSLEENKVNVLDYDIDLTIDDRLKADVTMKIAAKGDHPSHSKATFSLYHRFKISDVFLNGQKIPYDQNGDSVTVNLSTQEISDGKDTLTFQYEGASSPLFVANQQAVYLPYYFPWLPSTSSYPAMHYENFALHRNNHAETDKTHYQLTIHGQEPDYTNLNQKGKHTWEKTTDEGVTLAAGLLTEKDKGNDQFVYPLTWERGLEDLDKYKQNIKQMKDNIMSDLNLPETQMPETVVALPALSSADSMYHTEDLWLTKDTLLVSLSQGSTPGSDMFTSLNDNLIYRLVPALTWKREGIDLSYYAYYNAFDMTYGTAYNLDHGISDDKQITKSQLFQMVKNTDNTDKANALQAVSQLISKGDGDDLYQFSHDWYDLIQNEKPKWQKLETLASDHMAS
ncbi:hypothetical protein GCM10028778_27310 [Barrientosiimonas marina]